MLLSTAQTAAAQALVTFLGYQSGHAQNEALSFPEDVALAIAGHTADKPHAVEAIKDELSRLYDLRREGHALSAQQEMARQQQILAARVVIEREEECSPDDSIQAIRMLTDEELVEVAALPAESSAQLEAIFARASERLQATAAGLLSAAEDSAAAEQATIEAAARAATDAE